MESTEKCEVVIQHFNGKYLKTPPGIPSETFFLPPFFLSDCPHERRVFRICRCDCFATRARLEVLKQTWEREKAGGRRLNIPPHTFVTFFAILLRARTLFSLLSYSPSPRPLSSWARESVDKRGGGGVESANLPKVLYVCCQSHH